jgi:NAD(P)-dependent dehydrogenase (short-subunit alcohol dehydrogenase family)
MSPVYTLFSPNDIAAFLASDDSTWVSGQTIQASGGARL